LSLLRTEKGRDCKLLLKVFWAKQLKAGWIINPPPLLSRCSRLRPGGGAGGDGKCSARHFAQSMGSGVVGSPIVSFQRVNGLVRRASLDHLVHAIGY
jgi:hypothetical protein